MKHNNAKKNLLDTKPKKIAALVVMVALVLYLPKSGLLSPYLVRILTMISLYSMLSLSLNLLTGFTGLVSIGHAGFCAVGGYTSALMWQYLGLPWLVTAICGMIMAGVVGLMLAAPTSRLSGSYLTIATLGFGEIVKMIALNWQSFTGGPLGVNHIERPEFFGITLTTFNGGFFYLSIILTALVTLFVYRIVNSKMGRAFMAIRDDSLAATMMGVDVTAYKMKSFVISAAIAGLGGAFYVHFVRFLDPNTFNFDISIIIISIVILGGTGSIPGSFLGAALLISFPEILRFASEYRFIIYGLILVLMMRFKPEGILGGHSHRPFRLMKGVESYGN
ncbi:MAG: branched-chain amino acid ABC transporter permease [Sphaerochaeta sp.]|nr:branched-chain amino acid ABC transporter permease [Sphaerochaeta sp.]